MRDSPDLRLGARQGARPGQYDYGTKEACAAARKFTDEQCANAAMNSQAEYDEKTPRFASREACEHAFAGAGCTLGFKGADGWAGKKSGIYFSPRQSGFRVIVANPRDMAVVPVVSGPALHFSLRSILRRDTAINPRVAAARDSWRPPSPVAPGAAGVYGVDRPSGGDRGAIPPPPPLDPNFDCAAVLEPSAKESADTGCYKAPPRRR